MTGFPVLVNTSLNGAGEPIIETPEQAIEFFLINLDLDVLLLEDRIIHRKNLWTDNNIPDKAMILTDNIVTTIFPDRFSIKAIVTTNHSNTSISKETYEFIEKLKKKKHMLEIINEINSSTKLKHEINVLIFRGAIQIIDY